MRAKSARGALIVGVVVALVAVGSPAVARQRVNRVPASKPAAAGAVTSIPAIGFPIDTMASCGLSTYTYDSDAEAWSPTCIPDTPAATGTGDWHWFIFNRATMALRDQGDDGDIFTVPPQWSSLH